MKEVVDGSANSAAEWTQQLKEAADNTLNTLANQTMSSNQLRARMTQLEAELKAVSADSFASRLQSRHEQAAAKNAIATVATLEAKCEQLVAARDAAVLQIEQERATTKGVLAKLKADVRAAVEERNTALDDAQQIQQIQAHDVEREEVPGRRGNEHQRQRQRRPPAAHPVPGTTADRTTLRLAQVRAKEALAELEGELHAADVAAVGEQEAGRRAAARSEQNAAVEVAEAEARRARAETRAAVAERDAARFELGRAQAERARTEEAAAAAAAAASELMSAYRKAEEERTGVLSQLLKERTTAQSIAAAGAGEVDAVKRAAAAEKAAALEAAATEAMVELEAVKRRALEDKTASLQEVMGACVTVVKPS